MERYKGIINDDKGNKVDVNSLEPSERETLYMITRELYKNFILLNTYNSEHGYDILSRFCLDISYAILLDTAGYIGNGDDVKALNNIGNNGDNYYEYHNAETGYDEVIHYNYNEIYNLVNDASDCAEKAQENGITGSMRVSYDDKMYNNFETVIDRCKRCIYGHYSIEKSSFLGMSDQYINYSEGEVPTR